MKSTIYNLKFKQAAFTQAYKKIVAIIKGGKVVNPTGHHHAFDNVIIAARVFGEVLKTAQRIFKFASLDFGFLGLFTKGGTVPVATVFGTIAFKIKLVKASLDTLIFSIEGVRALHYKNDKEAAFRRDNAGLSGFEAVRGLVGIMTPSMENAILEAMGHDIPVVNLIDMFKGEDLSEQNSERLAALMESYNSDDDVSSSQSSNSETTSNSATDQSTNGEENDNSSAEEAKDSKAAEQAKKYTGKAAHIASDSIVNIITTVLEKGTFDNLDLTARARDYKIKAIKMNMGNLDKYADAKDMFEYVEELSPELQSEKIQNQEEAFRKHFEDLKSKIDKALNQLKPKVKKENEDFEKERATSKTLSNSIDVDADMST